MTLRELTEGYTTFANGGVKVEPVDDPPHRRQGRQGVLRRRAATARGALPADRGADDLHPQGRGRARHRHSVKALDRPVAGKTGTTNEQRDAWFIGYTPNLAVGVWVGFDDQTQTMGKMGTGGHVAAPIWLDFMKPALEGTPVRDFEIPEDINCVNIDPWSGKRASEWTAKPFLECFRAGTEPGGGGRGPPENAGRPRASDRRRPPPTDFGRTDVAAPRATAANATDRRPSAPKRSDAGLNPAPSRIRPPAESPRCASTPAAKPPGRLRPAATTRPARGLRRHRSGKAEAVAQDCAQRGSRSACSGRAARRAAPAQWQWPPPRSPSPAPAAGRRRRQIFSQYGARASRLRRPHG